MVEINQEKIQSEFTKNLNRILLEKNIQQNELANYVGVSNTTVNNWCKGYKMPRMNKVDKICSFLNISRSQLLDGIEEQKESYYLDPETAQLAQEIHDNPQYRVLFDASKNLKPESIKEIMKFIDYQKAKEGKDNE